MFLIRLLDVSKHLFDTFEVSCAYNSTLAKLTLLLLRFVGE
ncbi:hypothetical protein BSSC8_13550 [Bacillus subtilis subsp. subtilis str. SC-8]|nr:hypothetical protein BSSC8_13550 [Bacillus subtilis subsp. subtilis str. SC-8]